MIWKNKLVWQDRSYPLPENSVGMPRCDFQETRIGFRKGKPIVIKVKRKSSNA